MLSPLDIATLQRMRNFGPLGGSFNGPSPTDPNAGNNPTPVNIPQQQQQPPAVPPMMMQNFQPQTQAQDAYLRQIGNMPTRQPVSNARKIAATLAGLGTGGAEGIAGGRPIGYRSNVPGAIQTAQAITDMPYERQMQDWQGKSQALGVGAQNEAQRNNAYERYYLTEQERQIQEERNKITQDKNDTTNTRLMQDLQRKIDEADRAYSEKAKEWNDKQGNFETQMKNRDDMVEIQRQRAELAKESAAALESYRQRQLDERDRALGQKDTQLGQYEERTKLWKEYNEARTAGKDTSVFVFDKDGNLVGKKVTNVNPRTNPQPGDMQANNPLGLTPPGAR